MDKETLQLLAQLEANVTNAVTALTVDDRLAAVDSLTTALGFGALALERLSSDTGGSAFTTEDGR